MYLKYILLFLFIVISSCSFAQNSDFRMWMEMAVEKKITRKLSLETKGAIRLNENLAEVGSYYGNISIGYKFLKNFKLELQYRYSGKQVTERGISIRHRYFADLTYKIKTNTPLYFTIRGRFQKQYSNIFSDETGFIPNNNLRLAGLLHYKYKRYIPYLGVESFYEIYYRGNLFNRIRGKIGIEYKLDKRNDIDFFYILQNQLNSNNPTKANILGLSYKRTI